MATEWPVLDQYDETPQEDDEQAQVAQATKEESNEDTKIGSVRLEELSSFEVNAKVMRLPNTSRFRRGLIPFTERSPSSPVVELAIVDGTCIRSCFKLTKYYLIQYSSSILRCLLGNLDLVPTEHQLSWYCSTVDLSGKFNSRSCPSSSLHSNGCP